MRSLILTFGFVLASLAVTARDKPFRHTDDYPAIRLKWEALELGRAVASYPHPFYPQHVILVTQDGLQFSDDAGKNWEHRETEFDFITAIAFSPLDRNTILASTEDDGVWKTVDGKSWKQIGTEDKGLASDEVVSVHFDPNDQRGETIYACHGEAEPGISRSRDGGKTWDVIATSYHVFQLIFTEDRGPRVFVVAANKGAPDIRTVYSGVSVADYWYQVLRDVTPSDTAVPVHRSGAILVSTYEGKIHRVTRNFTEVLPFTSEQPIVSVGITRGPTEDQQLYFAFEPSKAGIVLSSDGFKTTSRQNHGFKISAFTRAGANLRANANGTVFYAVANRIAYRGTLDAGPLKPTAAQVDPPLFVYKPTTYNRTRGAVLDAMQQMDDDEDLVGTAKVLLAEYKAFQASASTLGFSVSARVNDSPQSVTVDLSRFGLSAETPMLDDGKHDDGDLGDGVYGTRFILDPRHLTEWRGDWRREPPGIVGLTVTAVKGGKKAGTVALLTVQNQLDSFRFNDGWNRGRVEIGGESDITHDRDLPEHRHQRCVELRIEEGEWYWSFSARQNYDITGFYAMTVWVRSERPLEEGITFQLSDNPLYSEKVETKAMDLTDAAVESGPITTDWRRLTIPLAPLLKDAPNLRTKQFGRMILRGDAEEPFTLYVGPVDLYRTKVEAGGKK